jgi:sigma-B regulation protein RsbU (phosphoserine phosphatase)
MDLHSYLERVKKRAAQFQGDLRRSKTYHLVRTYGDGMSSKEIESFFKRDTVQAYEFYRREKETKAAEPLPKNEFERALFMARDVFLSFLMKLTPARRLFYVGAMVMFLWGLVDMSLLKLGIAFVVLNFLLAFELADKLLAKDELEIARLIQFSLQPEEHPQMTRLRIASYYQPAREVGGDYYDFALLGENRFTLILGDVSGKGMPAALYAMKLQALFELLGKTRIGPKDMLVEMNEVMCEKIRRNYFITAVVGVMDFEANRLSLARAGHNLPLHFSAATETTQWLNPKGLGIGMKKNPDFGSILEETTLALGNEDLLLFYTDGITEAMNRQDKEFGCERLEKILKEHAHLNVEDIKDRLLWHVNKFTEGVPMADDATMVIAKVTE